MDFRVSQGDLGCIVCALQDSPPGAADAQARDAPDGSTSVVLTRAYIDKVVKALHVGEENFDVERRKEVAEQEKALELLALVLEGRLRSESSVAKGPLAFDARLDDDEAVLRLMLEVDTDGNGAISEKELLTPSSSLDPEVRKAFASAFECSPEAVEEALAHLAESDYGEYRRPPRRAAPAPWQR